MQMLVDKTSSIRFSVKNLRSIALKLKNKKLTRKTFNVLECSRDIVQQSFSPNYFFQNEQFQASSEIVFNHLTDKFWKFSYFYRQRSEPPKNQIFINIKLSDWSSNSETVQFNFKIFIQTPNVPMRLIQQILFVTMLHLTNGKMPEELKLKSLTAKSISKIIRSF